MRTLLVTELEIDPEWLIKVLHYDGTPITARFIIDAITDAITDTITDCVHALAVAPRRERILAHGNGASSRSSIASEDGRPPPAWGR